MLEGRESMLRAQSKFIAENQCSQWRTNAYRGKSTLMRESKLNVHDGESILRAENQCSEQNNQCSEQNNQNSQRRINVPRRESIIIAES
jgi:hypothetical protein